MAGQEDFKIEAHGTVSPPPGKAFCPNLDDADPCGLDCPLCHGTWVVDER